LIFLTYIPLGLLALLLWTLVRKSAYKAVPCFFAYTAFAVAADVTRFLVHNHRHPYYAAYWFTEAGYDLLGILVMYEVLRTVLGNLTRAWWARLIFPAVLVAGVGISLARADVVPSRLGGLLFYIVVGEIAVRFVQVFVFAGLVTLVPLLGSYRVWALRHGYAADHNQVFGFWNKIQIFVGSNLTCGILACRVDLDLVFQRATKSRDSGF